MGIIEEIKSLATTIGTDVKALRNDKANKNDFDRVVTALNNIADGLKGNTSNNQAGANTNVATNSGTVSESFAQRVVKELIKNHYPYLKSEEDNFSKFVEFIYRQGISINEVNQPNVFFKDNVLTISFDVSDNKFVKVKYVIDGENHEEVVTSAKSFINVDSLKYRECDYYGVYGEKYEKIVNIDAYRKQMTHPENYIFEQDTSYTSSIRFNKLTDNSDYDVLNLDDRKFYDSIGKKRSYDISGSEYSDSSVGDMLREFKFNGNIKIAICDISGYCNLGVSIANSETLKNNPKYIAINYSFLPNRQNVTLMGKDIDIESRYNSSDSSGTWDERENKFNKTKTAIYRWDESQNKYMFESADTLEDWLKTHPLETL